MIKLCFIDTETTGTNAKINGVHQISGQICYLEESLEEHERFDYKVKPFDTDIIEAAALQVGHVTKFDIMQYPSPMAIYKHFTSLLSNHCNKYDKNDKMFFIGYNARFDYDFMRTWFEKNGDKYFGSFFFFPPVDVMNIAIWNMLQERSMLENFKLETVTNYLGIKINGKLHDAMVDIELTKEIFMRFLNKKEN